jgi:DNA-binding NarL/FixJ family response regulator
VGDRKRILVVDDHALVREGICALLKLQPDMEVVGEASDGRQALEMASRLRPDIVLMDISMPGLGGIEATYEIRKKYPDIKILILSQYDDAEYVRRLINAGISGYILKHALVTELVSAICAVSRGEMYLYPAVASQVVDQYLGRRAQVEDPYEKLTEREKQVLKLLAEGASHKEIASMLGISAKTAITHQTNISQKLSIHSRAALIKFALKRGIIKIED